MNLTPFRCQGPRRRYRPEIEIISLREGKKGQQIDNVANYQRSQNTEARLRYLQKAARDPANVFAALIEAVKSYSLGQISHALYDVGGVS